MTYPAAKMLSNMAATNNFGKVFFIGDSTTDGVYNNYIGFPYFFTWDVGPALNLTSLIDFGGYWSNPYTTTDPTKANQIIYVGANGVPTTTTATWLTYLDPTDPNSIYYGPAQAATTLNGAAFPAGPWDIFIVGLGINDFLHDTEASVGTTILANLETIIGLLRQFNPNGTIIITDENNLGTTPPFNGAFQQAMSTVSEYICGYTLPNMPIPVMPSTVPGYNDVWFMDTMAAAPNRWDPSTIADGIHPNAQGYADIGEFIAVWGFTPGSATVIGPPMVITTTVLNSMAYNVPFTQTLTSDPAATTWAVSKGPLPTGLNLDATSGLLWGTPSSTTQTSYDFTVRASTVTQSVTQEYKGSIARSFVAPAPAAVQVLMPNGLYYPTTTSIYTGGIWKGALILASTASLLPTVPIAAPFAGTGTVYEQQSLLVHLTVPFAGEGTLAALAAPPTFGGAGTLTATVLIAAPFSGGGVLTATGPIAAPFSGGGSLSNGFGGAGTLTALTGTPVAAPFSGNGSLSNGFEGAGTLAASATVVASISIDQFCTATSTTSPLTPTITINPGVCAYAFVTTTQGSGPYASTVTIGGTSMTPLTPSGSPVSYGSYFVYFTSYYEVFVLNTPTTGTAQPVVCTFTAGSGAITVVTVNKSIPATSFISTTGSAGSNPGTVTQTLTSTNQLVLQAFMADTANSMANYTPSGAALSVAVPIAAGSEPGGASYTFTVDVGFPGGTHYGYAGVAFDLAQSP
jgi:lysophospholipase L1-like esterase